jgi:hypothetical protein
MMGLYNFQQRFAKAVRKGDKTHTIRAKRKHPDYPGCTFFGYTGLRTKKAKRLITSTVVRVEDILIRKTCSLSDDATDIFEVAIDGVGLEDSEKELLARRDGFNNFADMMRFWTGRLPFIGHIIHWKYPEGK